MQYLLRRIGFYLAALWVAITVNFLLPRLMPGDPVLLLVARLQGRVDPHAIDALRIQFGLNTNQTLFQQYLNYLNDLAHGNFGISISNYPTPVSDVIGTSLAWTLVLVGTSAVISFVVGTMLGALAAWKRGSWFDTVFSPLLTFFQAIPYFWLALLLLYVLGLDLRWFPLGFGYDIDLTPGFNFDFILSAVDHAILPAFTIVISSVAGWMLGMRNAMLTTLAEDYVLMAQAKGLSERRVLITYAARNAILPNITGFAISLGFVIGGALLTEIIFSYPGIGFILLSAVQAEDYPLMQAIFLLIALIVLIANFLADLLYVVLDPRVRQEG
ncbi:MAG TPA: ABC transporter permease [Ktedonobacterales bacterium]|nr:ABC transporter permease [Ktedonobacterales bacterium]